MNRNHIDQLYMRYGYDIQEGMSNNNVRIYTLKKGVYFGADIVYFDKKENLDSLAKELSNSGFACRLKNFENIVEAENFLFDSFFHSSQLNQRLLTKYNSFTITSCKICLNIAAFLSRDNSVNIGESFLKSIAIFCKTSYEVQVLPKPAAASIIIN